MSPGNRLTENPIRTAVQGTGRWGRNLLRALMKVDGVEVTWIVDPDPIALAEAAAIAPHAKTAAAILQTGFDFDAAAVATPAAEHVPHVRALLAHEKHILVEKPAAMNETDAAALVREATDRNVRLMSGHQLCFHPVFQTLKAHIESGLIGQPTHIEAERTGPVDFTKEPGVLWSYGPHDISMLLALLNRSPEQSVVSLRKGKIDLPLEADLHLTIAPNLQVKIHLNGTGDEKKRRFTVRGERGVLTFDDTVPGGRLLYTDDTGNTKDLEFARDKDALRLECEHFVTCIRTKTLPFTGGKHLTEVTRIVGEWHNR